MSLQKQGANRGAVAAFLISTPESGVDSVAISYALLDPILTVARPMAAFITAVVAGIAENLSGHSHTGALRPDRRCVVDGCCDGIDCAPRVHRRHHSVVEKIVFGLRFAKDEVWADISGWFFLGLIAAGLITVVIPEEFIRRYVGGGWPAMLIMLTVGIPLYICASASTPIAAALILKGVSPGAALVFLLAGPATNITSLTVLLGLLGKRATAIYFAAIAACTILFGMLLDWTYLLLEVSPGAVVGQAGEILPYGVKVAGAVFVLLLSVPPLARKIRRRFRSEKDGLTPVVQIQEKPPASPRGNPCGEGSS